MSIFSCCDCPTQTLLGILTWKRHPQIKLKCLRKNIWDVGTSNRLYLRGSYYET